MQDKLSTTFVAFKKIMGKLFQLHILIALLCLFSIEQSMSSEITTNNSAAKHYSSRCLVCFNAYNVLELAEEELVAEASVPVSYLKNAKRFPFLMNILWIDCHIVINDNIPFQTDKSPPHA